MSELFNKVFDLGLKMMNFRAHKSVIMQPIFLLLALGLSAVAYPANETHAQTREENRHFREILIMPWPNAQTPPSEYDPDSLEIALKNSKKKLQSALNEYIRLKEQADDPNTHYYSSEDGMWMTTFKATLGEMFYPPDVFLLMGERALIDARLSYWKVKRKLFERDQMRLIEELSHKLTLASTPDEKKNQIAGTTIPNIKNRIRYNALMYRYELGMAEKEKYRSTDISHEFSQTERGFGVAIGATELLLARKFHMTPGRYIKKYIRPFFQARTAHRARSTPEGKQSSARVLNNEIQRRLDVVSKNLSKLTGMPKALSQTNLTRNFLYELESGSSFQKAVSKARILLSSGNALSSLHQSILKQHGTQGLIKHLYFNEFKVAFENADLMVDLKTRMRSLSSWNSLLNDPHFKTHFSNLTKVSDPISADGRKAALSTLTEMEKTAKAVSTSLEEAIARLKSDVKKLGKVLAGNKPKLTKQIKTLRNEATKIAKAKGTSHPDYLAKINETKRAQELLNKIVANHLEAAAQLKKISTEWKKGARSWLSVGGGIRTLGLVFSLWITYDGVKNILGHGSVMIFENALKLEDEGKAYELDQSWFFGNTSWWRHQTRFFKDYRKNQEGVYSYINPTDLLFLSYAAFYSAEKTDALLEMERVLQVAENELSAELGRSGFKYDEFNSSLNKLKTHTFSKLQALGMSGRETQEIENGFSSVFEQAKEIHGKQSTSAEEINRLKVSVDQLLGSVLPFILAPNDEETKELMEAVENSYLTIEVDQRIDEFDAAKFSKFELDIIEANRLAKKQKEKNEANQDPARSNKNKGENR